MPLVTRFAPSPTGHLHLGHAFSAMTVWLAAKSESGRFLLRIEDIDFTRCKEEFIPAILEDLQWLGLHWPEPIRRQSQHLHDYATAAEKLREQGLLYPCFCTRSEIQQEVAAAGGAPHGADGPLYPGTCRRLTEQEQQHRIQAGQEYALRLDVQRAIDRIGKPLRWLDRLRGWQVAAPGRLGDVVLVRKDIGCSYHLAVVHDDALQDVNLIIRGEDLFEATHLHRLVQALLNLPTPEYHHHPLLCDAEGRRLAKRNLSETLQSLRKQGVTGEQVRRRLGFD